VTQIVVTEEHDPQGDLRYFVALTTYSRSALNRLADLFGCSLSWPDRSLGDEDLAEALRERVREVKP
jgi:hypothetical protein